MKTIPMSESDEYSDISSIDYPEDRSYCSINENESYIENGNDIEEESLKIYEKHDLFHFCAKQYVWCTFGCCTNCKLQSKDNTLCAIQKDNNVSPLSITEIWPDRFFNMEKRETWLIASGCQCSDTISGHLYCNHCLESIIRKIDATIYLDHYNNHFIHSSCFFPYCHSENSSLFKPILVAAFLLNWNEDLYIQYLIHAHNIFRTPKYFYFTCNSCFTDTRIEITTPFTSHVVTCKQCKIHLCFYCKNNLEKDNNIPRCCSWCNTINDPSKDHSWNMFIPRPHNIIVRHDAMHMTHVMRNENITLDCVKQFLMQIISSYTRTKGTMPIHCLVCNQAISNLSHDKWIFHCNVKYCYHCGSSSSIQIHQNHKEYEICNFCHKYWETRCKVEEFDYDAHLLEQYQKKRLIVRLKALMASLPRRISIQLKQYENNDFIKPYLLYV